MSKTQRSFQEGSNSTQQRFVPEVEATLPNDVNWVPRKTNLQTVTPEQRTEILDQSNILTTVPASMTSTQKSTRSEPPQFTIQVGAYKTEVNANQMVSNLLEKGYRARITPDTKNGTPLFKVHVDKFGNKKQALKLTKKFATEESLSSFVTTISSN